MLADRSPRYKSVKMKIDHIAIWTNNLETLRSFYIKYFHGESGEKYRNDRSEFESYFISFSSGSRLEIMTISGLETDFGQQNRIGIAHLSFRVGSKKAVDLLTSELRSAGISVYSEPRITGDGYYESGILDPDGNRVEIIA